ncbi:MAG: isochorismatase family protein [Victivallales bacterium]|jgi:nicotinamidase-related amidase|nr:isochorismatase family protein [Victivallales bacterium]
MIFPEIKSTSLVVIDLQERLIKAMDNAESVQKRAEIMLQGATALGLDVLCSEQYPNGLGKTIPEIAELLPPGSVTVEKTAFSVFAEPKFRTALAAKSKKNLIFIGIESHVCVLQSVYDALNADFEVFVVSDAVTSRDKANCQSALKAMRHAGANVLPLESVLFMLLRDAKHPAFKTISKLIR